MANIATCSVASAQARIHNLSDNMIAELQKLQMSSKELSVSLSETIQNRAQNLAMPSLHETYAGFADNLTSAIHELRCIVADDAPWADKVARIRNEVKERVTPMLEAIRTRGTEVLARGKEAAPAASDQVDNTEAEAPTVT